MPLLKLERPLTLVIAKAEEIYNTLNIAEEDFKAPWQTSEQAKFWVRYLYTL